jgi:hypothetical protein
VAGENVHKLFDCHDLRKADAYQTKSLSLIWREWEKENFIEN